MDSSWISRTLLPRVERQFARGKSVLLLGPRQTGKTTLLERLSWDLRISFLVQKTRLAFERNPDLLIEQIEALDIKRPRVLIDEVQKIPRILDVVQYLADKRMALFALTGSSARKLRSADAVNLLPGRLVLLRMDPLTLPEYDDASLPDLLLYGSLPQVLQTTHPDDRDFDLESYVSTFIDEEVRKEALVRNVPAFSRFIELAAIDSGQISNFSNIASQIGVAHTTIAQHYQILEDCLLVERFSPIIESASRSKLTRSSKYVLFDLGVRRLAANEGRNLSPERMGQLFEQYVGLELRRELRARGISGADVQFWRDPDGPEVDWVLTRHGRWIPIEVKWTNSPTVAAARHLEVFLNEHPQHATQGFVVCRVSEPQQLTPRIRAIPWQRLPDILKWLGTE